MFTLYIKKDKQDFKLCTLLKNNVLLNNIYFNIYTDSVLFV